MIEQIQQQLEPLLASHEGTTALFLSGGSDSLLLLHILRQMQAQFSCVTFDHSYTREQTKALDEIVDRFGLRVFSYAPSDSYLIGKGDKVAMVEEYAMLGTTFPFVRDCVDDAAECIYTGQFSSKRQPVPPIGFTLHLYGTRKGDRHAIVGKAWREPTVSDGKTVHHSPLWNLTRLQVRRLLRVFDEPVPKVDTGTVPLCTKCLTTRFPGVICPQSKKMIPRHEWDPELNTQGFQQRFGLV